MRRFPARLLAPVVAAVVLVALVAALALPEDDGDATPLPLTRPNPAIEPFGGFGVWVDIYDEQAWADPRTAVRDMARHGVRTLFLQTSNADRPGSLVFPGQTEIFVDAAHDAGMGVVAWYLPHLTDMERERARVLDALAFATDRGDRFDGFALDIESAAVPDPSRRSARLVRLSQGLRAEAGARYPLGAIVPSPLRLRDDEAYWPGFPWRELALTYDAILPMTYFTFRATGPRESSAYVSGSIEEIRERVGTDAVPIHVIGGLARDMSEAEALAFARAVGEAGVAGASIYTWPFVTTEQWRVMRRIG